MDSLFLKNSSSFDIIYLGCEDMEGLLVIIFIIVVIIIIFSIFYAITYNKFQDYIIRINEVESMIDNNLSDDLIMKSLNITFEELQKFK